MHIGRKTQVRKDGSRAVYLVLRTTYRPNGGQPQERVFYLGRESAEDIAQRAGKKLRRVGYTAAECREILAAVRAKVDRNEYRAIVVRNRPVPWREPKR